MVNNNLNRPLMSSEQLMIFIDFSTRQDSMEMQRKLLMSVSNPILEESSIRRYVMHVHYKYPHSLVYYHYDLQEYMKGIRDVIFWFVTNFGPHYDETASELQLKNDLALDISFGSIGYSLIMARPFVKVQKCSYIYCVGWPYLSSN